MLFQVSEKRLVGMAVGVLGKKGPGGGISSYGATAMTEGKIVTGKAIFLLNEEPGAGCRSGRPGIARKLTAISPKLINQSKRSVFSCAILPRLEIFLTIVSSCHQWFCSYRASLASKF